MFKGQDLVSTDVIKYSLEPFICCDCIYRNGVSLCFKNKNLIVQTGLCFFFQTSTVTKSHTRHTSLLYMVCGKYILTNVFNSRQKAIVVVHCYFKITYVVEIAFTSCDVIWFSLLFCGRYSYAWYIFTTSSSSRSIVHVKSNFFPPWVAYRN